MKKFLFLLLFFLGLGLLIKFVPISLEAPASITVTGEAKRDEVPQIARFSASVTATNVDKQTAVNEVNSAMEKIIKSVKDFGIDQKDIQTQQVSVYQTKEGRLSDKDVWQASNSISLKLRNIDQASALTDLLQQSNATNVYGPNYSLDDTTQAQADLLAKAIDNAREKAAKIAAASQRKLGKIITVSEGGTVMPGPVFRAMSVAETVPAPVEPGSETVYQSVTVTFELK